MKSIALTLFLWLFLVGMPGRALGNTYYVDGQSGNDTNSGTSRSAAWRTWARMLAGIDAGTVAAGDTVLIRPGRYYAIDGGGNDDNWFLKGPAGGAPGRPITVSVDTHYSGDVEIAGSMPGDFNTAHGKPQDRTGDWKATTDPDGHKIYYMVDDTFRLGASQAPGVAFQPGSAPGAAPLFYELLYSPEASPTSVPVFTPGKNQCWAAFVGGERRIYAQTASGQPPDQVSPPVEVPFYGVLDLGLNGTVSYLTFTNHNNGRKFYFWWGTVNILALRDVHHITFEDFDVAYNSAITTWPPGTFGRPSIESGSGFPRDGGGPMYLIFHAAGSSTHNHHVIYRRGTIHYAAGDETIHMDCPHYCVSAKDIANSGHHRIEDVEVAFTPWQVANGTPVYPGGGPYSWPPPNYSAGWAQTYPTQYSPLGGGGQSPSAWIIAQPNNTVRRVKVHDFCGIVSFEGQSAYGQLVENSRFDGAGRKDGGDYNTVVPICPVATCSNGPAPNACHGFSIGPMFRNDHGGLNHDVQGNVYRNNIIFNGYGTIFGDYPNGGGTGRYAGFALLNSTIQSKGDGTYVSGQTIFASPLWGTAKRPARMQNNTLVRDVASTSDSLYVNPGAQVVINGNLYGPKNMLWHWENNAPTTSFPTWQAQSGQDGKSPTPADPMFVNNKNNFYLRPGSPAIDHGLNLPDVKIDYRGTHRPQGAAYDIGAFEFIFFPR